MSSSKSFALFMLVWFFGFIACMIWVGWKRWTTETPAWRRKWIVCAALQVLWFLTMCLAGDFDPLFMK